MCKKWVKVKVSSSPGANSHVTWQKFIEQDMHDLSSELADCAGWFLFSA